MLKCAGRSFVHSIAADIRELKIHAPPTHQKGLPYWLWLMGGTDAFWILLTHRIRVMCRQWHIPLVSRLLRSLQLVLYGIEISPDATIGHGVVFLHPVGVVVGGNSVVGDRCLFLGSNTLGTINLKKYPTLAADIVVGAGARILDGVKVGAGASIGANAVVISDVPLGATAVGVPARILQKSLCNRSDNDSLQP